ncbi:unnamed protein product, partial [Urochloa humidicola]
SEYAAWTLVKGFALNHATIATHRLQSDIRSINKFNKFVEDNGFKLNSEGGILKVSPDGLLQQSSTVADSSAFTFADGITESIPRSYIEFSEHLLLRQFKDLQDEENTTGMMVLRWATQTAYLRARQSIGNSYSQKRHSLLLLLSSTQYYYSQSVR